MIGWWRGRVKLVLACSAVLLAAALIEGGPAPEGCGAAARALIAESEPGPAERRWADGGAEIWRRKLKGGAQAFILVNRGERAVSIDVIWKEHGLRGSPRVTDVARGRDRGKVHAGFAERVEPGGASVLRVKP